MENSLNPYGKHEVTVPQRGQLDVEISRSLAEVQAMVLMAKKFPRDPIEATERILNECRRPSLAEVALYSYSRGGTEITGPSIRLAECVARNWGNIESGVRELSQGNGQSEMLSFCWDLESNSRNSKVFTVKHERHTRQGKYPLSDPRDIYEQNANLAARRLRAVILATVPGDVVEAAVNQCEETLKAKADTSPEALKKMVESFAAFNVVKLQIEKRIQRKLESITAAQFVSLRKIYNSIRDGMSAPADWFEDVAPAKPATSGTAAAKEAIAKRKTVKEMTAEAPEPPPPPPPEASIPCPKLDEGETVRLSQCEECASRAGCPSHG